MLTLIYNEFRKLLRRKKTYVILLGFAAVMALLMFGKYKDCKNMEKWNKPEFQLEQLKKSVSSTEEYLKNVEKDISNVTDEKMKANLIKEKEFSERNMEDMKESIKRLEEAIKSGVEVDWRKDLDAEIKNMEKFLEEENNMPQKYKLRQQRELNNLKILREKGIKPLKGYEFEGYSFLIFALKDVIFILIPLLVVVLVSDMVSGECTPPTLKFLLTQPVKRWKVLAAKFITSLIASLVIIFSVQLLSFLVVGLIGSFGSPDYPMSYGTKYFFDMTKLDEMKNPILVEIAGSTKTIAMSTYIFRMFLIEGLFILATCAFGFMLSVLAKSSMISMVVSTVSVFGLTILSLIGSGAKSLAPFLKNLFLTYGSIPNLMEGQYVVNYNNLGFTLERGIIVMAVWAVVCYIIAHLVFTKRDILI